MLSVERRMRSSATRSVYGSEPPHLDSGVDRVASASLVFSAESEIDADDPAVSLPHEQGTYVGSRHG